MNRPESHPLGPSSPTYCVMPWINLSTETNGNCKICCVVMRDRYITKPDGTPFRLHNDAIEEIWNSEYLRDVRKKMLSGERVPDCSYCYEREDQGAISPRQDYNVRMPATHVSQDLGRSNGVASQLPVSLEPRPGTACNLRCASCWSMSSSRVEIERRKMLADPTMQIPGELRPDFENEIAMANQSDFAWSERPRYLETFRKCLPGLKRLYFTGGEPMLIKSNISMMEELIDAGKRDCVVAFTTNLTVLSEKILNLLTRFERAEVTCSLDGIESVTEYLRYPSRWETVSRNLLRYARLPTSVGVSVMSLAQAENIDSIIDLAIWLHRNSPRPIAILPTLLQSPDFLRVDTLPLEIQLRHARRIDQELQSDQIHPVNHSALQSIRLGLGQLHPDADRLTQLRKKYFELLDRARGTDYRQALKQTTTN